MAISFTVTDEMDEEKTHSAAIWLKEWDRAKMQALPAIFTKHQDTGDVIIGVEDLEDIVGHEIVISLEDGADSEYVGTVNEDGLFVKS